MRDISKKMIAISIVFCLLFSNFATLISYAVDDLSNEISQKMDNSNNFEIINQENNDMAINQKQKANEINNLNDYNDDTEELEKSQISEEISEQLEGDLEVLKAYKTSKGAIVKLKVFEKTSNMQDELKNTEIRLKAPEIEGYNLIKANLEEVNLNDESLEYTSINENNDVIINIVKKEETLEVQEDTDNENDINEYSSALKLEEDKENAFQIINSQRLQNIFGRVKLDTAKDTEREYIVVYKFEGDSEVSKINFEIKENLNYLNLYSKELEAKVEKDLYIDQDTQNEYAIYTENQSISKGYMYVNSVSDFNYETNFSSINKVKLNSLDNIDKIILTNEADKVITKQNTEIDISKYVNYKKTAINVNQFSEILGEEGFLEVFSEGKSLGRIDKTSQIEDDRYIFIYPENINSVEFSINNIENTGDLELLNDKIIVGTKELKREEIVEFDKIKSNFIAKEFLEEQDNLIEISNISSNIEIDLEDTESRMDLSLSSKDFSTEMLNDVMINVTLKTNEEKYELFKNPTIEVEFPKKVEDISIKNINLLYKNGLSIDNFKVEEKESGEKVVKIQLKGIQNEYAPGTMIEGTQVVIYANVKLNKLIANESSNLKLRYTNEIGTNTSYQNLGNDSETYQINYVSRSGLLKSTTFENFNKNLDSVFNFENDVNIGSLDVQADSKTAKMSMTVLNNYDIDISNVEILGRIPVKGNADKDGNDLNTTIDTYLKSEITVSGLESKIYYSTDTNATKDSDTWQESVEDITQVKSYKIVIQNGIMEKGKTISFEYELEIPENLTFNEKMYGVYSVYYNLNGETIVEDSIIGAETEFKELKLEDYQTQEVIPETSLGIGTQVTLAGKVIDENAEVNEGQILRYNIIVTNNGKKAINNIKLNGTVENGNIYYQNKYDIISSTTGQNATTYDWIEDTNGEHTSEEMTIDSLKPGEVKTQFYQVVAKNPESEINGNIEISADGMETKQVSTIKNKVLDADLKIFVTTGIHEDINYENLSSNSSFRIKTELENISDKDLENFTLEIQMPSFVKLDKNMTELVYDIETESIKQGNNNIVNVFIDKLSANEKKDITIFVGIDNIDLDKIGEELTIISKANILGKEYISNDYTRYAEQSRTKFEVEYTANRENGSTVHNEDEIIYKLKVTNTGVRDGIANIVDSIPYGVNIKEITVKHGDGTNDSIAIGGKYFSKGIQVKSKETITLEIKGNVDISDCRTNQKVISNIFKVENEFVEGDLKEYIYEIGYPDGYLDDEYDENDDVIDEANKVDNQNDDSEETFDISKLINQTNNNKETNTTQQSTDNNSNIVNSIAKNNSTTNNVNNTVSNVIRKKYSISGYVWYDENKNGLYDNEQKVQNIKVYLYNTSTSVISEKNLKATTFTDKDGKYSFNNIDSGDYVVLFEYDTTLYSATEYKVNNGSDSNKSYVIEKNVTLNGKEKTYGVSDIISLSKNITDINIGLVNKNEFDMEIKTYLDSVIIVNKKENKTEKFDKDSKINKIEISSKYIDGTKITAKFKIVVTNKGSLSGFINQIADSIPNGFKFDENMNKNWSVGNDQRIYNSSLSKTEIKPGESKELILILTKEMTGNDTGTFKNEVSILDSTNSLKLQDKNKENDNSYAELLISIKTGIVVYLSITLFTIAIGLMILAIIDTKFLKNKLFRKAKFITVFILALILTGTITTVYAEPYSPKGENSDAKLLSIIPINDFFDVTLIKKENFYSKDYTDTLDLYGYEVDINGNKSYPFGTDEEYLKNKIIGHKIIYDLSTWMCIEGHNIDGVTNDGTKDRLIISWADFNSDLNEKDKLEYRVFKDINGNTTTEGTPFNYKAYKDSNGETIRDGKFNYSFEEKVNTYPIYYAFVRICSRK